LPSNPQWGLKLKAGKTPPLGSFRFGPAYAGKPPALCSQASIFTFYYHCLLAYLLPLIGQKQGAREATVVALSNKGRAKRFSKGCIKQVIKIFCFFFFLIGFRPVGRNREIKKHKKSR